MENKNVFNSFLNCTRLPLSRTFHGSLFHRVGPAQANECWPKRSKYIYNNILSNTRKGTMKVNIHILHNTHILL